MATVTALRRGRHGQVLVEVDGAEWRALPADVLARAAIGVGSTLDRPRLRIVRRELRRSEAVAVAARALRQRDLSRSRLTERLERGGFAPAARRDALDTLARAGLLDDQRFARERARVLAERDTGDAGIRWELRRQGVEAEAIELALAELTPELRRAERIAAARGANSRTARYLASRGFGADAIDALMSSLVADEP